MILATLAGQSASGFPVIVSGVLGLQVCLVCLGFWVPTLSPHALGAKILYMESSHQIDTLIFDTPSPSSCPYVVLSVINSGDPYFLYNCW